MRKHKWLAAAIAGAVVLGLTMAAVPALASPWKAQGAGRGFAGFGGPAINSVAKLLGMTTSDIAAQRQAGESMVDIAAARGVDLATLVNTVIADRQAQLDSLVKAGRITQAQADKAIEVMKDNVTANLSRTAVGRPDNAGQCGLNLGPHGNARGRGPGNGFNGQCPWNQAPVNQTPPGK